MRLLLDTHVLIWALSDPAQLPEALRAAIEAPENSVHVSAASVWEIAIKAAIGKIDVAAVDLAGSIAEIGFTELPVTVKHASAVLSLPQPHRDPFDRMLAAQSSLEKLTLVTKDPVFALYGTKTMWR